MKTPNTPSTIGKRAANMRRHTPMVLAATDTQFLAHGAPMEVVCKVLDDYVKAVGTIESMLDGNRRVATEFDTLMSRDYRSSLLNLETPYLETPELQEVRQASIELHRLPGIKNFLSRATHSCQVDA